MQKSLRSVLVVSDMDGTLLADDKTLHPADLAAIRLFTSMGGNFTVATGRVAESVARYRQLLPFLAPAVTTGGCVVYDFQKAKALQSLVLPSNTSRRVLTDLWRLFPDVGVVVMAEEERVYLLRASVHTQQLFEDEKLHYYMAPQAELPKHWNKVLFAGPHNTLLEMQRFVEKQNYQNMNFLLTAHNYFEMLPPDATKGVALRSVCEQVNISLSETIVIGDYYNDIDMMKVAGYSVAMGNAPQDIKEIASEVTADNNASGVGQFLYKLIKKYDT